MVPKPTFNKSANERGWRQSDYMRFKHEVANAFDVVYAYSIEKPSKGHLYDFTMSEFATEVRAPDRLSFDELLVKGADSRYLGLFDELCDLYDRRIHIRYPGEAIADNRFTPISYVTNKKGQFVGMDAAAGLIDSEIFSSLNRGTQATLTRNYTLAEVDKNPKLLRELYSASIYPTKADIETFLDDPTTKAKIKAITNKEEPTQIGKTLVVLNREFHRPLSELIPEIVENYGVTAKNPIVLYYPMCRAFSEDPETKAEKKQVQLARAKSFEAEVTGRMDEDEPPVEYGKGAGAGTSTGPSSSSGYGKGAGAGTSAGKTPSGYGKGASSAKAPSGYGKGAGAGSAMDEDEDESTVGYGWGKPGGRRRRTYRKKKFRTQTRRRRQ